MRNSLLLAACTGLLSLLSFVANATEIKPVKDNWYLFDVDEFISLSGGAEWVDAQVDESHGYIADGSSLWFSFSLDRAAFLNVVDAGIAGDMFTVFVNGVSHSTSSVAATSVEYAGIDFDAAWAAPAFSRLSILLSPGDYLVTGLLQQSAVDGDGYSYMTTVGGLQIVEADESSSLVLLGVGVLGLLLRRQKTLFNKLVSLEGTSK